MRLAAIRSLGELGGDDAREGLVYAFDDKRAEVPGSRHASPGRAGLLRGSACALECGEDRRFLMIPAWIWEYQKAAMLAALVC